MDDLVSRDWLLKHLFFEVDKELVRKAPDAQKHGRWVRNGEEYSFRVMCDRCSVCGSSQGIEWMKFCPNCGAIMDRDRDG